MLRDHLKGRVGKGSKPGHPIALTQEAEIVSTCIIFAEWGFGLNRMEL